MFLLALASPGVPALAAAPTQADHVLLFVLEGVENEAIKTGAMPTLHKLATEGAVTWNAQSVSPPLAVPAMASLLTGLPVARHRVNREWETYDFSRSFLRAPTMFDYLDLAGGVDTALFIMDERFYQLARPEIYVDMQTCGKAKPQCTPSLLVEYIKDYLKKVTSEGGYNFRIFAVPGLLVAHLPEPADVARKRGRDSEPYRASLKAVDTAVADTMAIYRDHGVLDKTMVIVTSLYSEPTRPATATATVNGAPAKSHSDVTSLSNGRTTRPATALPTSPPTVNGAKAKTHSDVFWLSFGVNVKPGHTITRPVSIMDTGATVLEALGLETHTEWDSRALTDIFQTKPERRTTGNERLAVH